MGLGKKHTANNSMSKDSDDTAPSLAESVQHQLQAKTLWIWKRGGTMKVPRLRTALIVHTQGQGVAPSGISEVICGLRLGLGKGDAGGVDKNCLPPTPVPN